MLITEAYAQAAGATGGPQGMFGAILPILLIIPIFYFFLIRPQSKRQKDHKAMIAAVKRGDRVVTTGGIVGQISKVIDDNEVQLEIAENVRVRLIRGGISEVLTRSEPAKTAQDNAADKKSDGR